MDTLDGRGVEELSDGEVHSRVSALVSAYHPAPEQESHRPTTGLLCCRCGNLDAHPQSGYCPVCTAELEDKRMTPKYVSPTLVKSRGTGRGQSLPLPRELVKLIPVGVEYRVELSDEGILFRPADPTSTDSVQVPDWVRAERANGNGSKAAALPPRARA